MSQEPANVEPLTSQTPPIPPRYFFWAQPPMLVLTGGVVFYLFSYPPRLAPDRWKHAVAILVTLWVVQLLVMIPAFPWWIRFCIFSFRRQWKEITTQQPRPDPKTNAKELWAVLRLRPDLAEEYEWFPIYYYGGWIVCWGLGMTAVALNIWRTTH